jgi:hypothetical protein
MRTWQRVERRFRDGHAERWWAAELTLFGYCPGKPVRAACATTDRRTLPELSTWYLSTNLPVGQAPLAEVVRLYGLRNWIEQGYKQMKDELGWADFMVRSDRAIRRHWALVCCAFAFCWWHEAVEVRLHEQAVSSPARKKNRASAHPMLLATPAARGAFVAGPGTVAALLLARILQHAPAARTRRAGHVPDGRMRHQPLSPVLTNYR